MAVAKTSDGRSRFAGGFIEPTLRPDRRGLAETAVEFVTSRSGTLSFLDLENGVPPTFARLAETQGLTRDDIRTIIPDRTLERRIATNEPFKMEEADGIARLLRVVAMARRVFGDNTLADEWLRSANPSLANHIPIRMARSDLGGREVEAALGRLEHGVFA